MPITIRPVEDRFWEKVFKTPDCWVWTGAKTYRGYGRIGLPGDKYKYTHRLSYELYVGEIPEGLQVLHRCDNRACIRPEHLFVGTAADNTADMIQKDRMCRGERQPNSKLKTEQVLEIRKLRAQGVRVRDVAKQFKIGHAHVTRIARRTRWAHLEG